MDTTTDTLAELLELVPDDDLLTASAKDQIVSTAGNQPLRNVATMSAMSLAKLIKGPAIPAPLPVATRLLQLTEQALHVVEASTAEVPTANSSIAAMLTYLCLEPRPEDYQEIIDLLLQKRQLQIALRKTDKWVIPATKPAPGKPTGINIEGTVRYVSHLASSMFSKKQTTFEGATPVTLERALGLNERPLIHPFTLEPVIGPVDGHDLADLDPELHKALLWAGSLKPRHRAWPVDLFTAWEEIFQPTEQLGGRLALILSEYQAAEAESEEGLGINRYYTQQQGRVALVLTEIAQATPVKNEEYYRALLRQNANGDLNRSGMSYTVTGGVYNRVSLSGMSATIRGIVVLEGGDISGMSANGTVYVPRGVNIDISGMSASVEIKPCTYEQLARLAGLI